jgi:hypothetical protein
MTRLGSDPLEWIKDTQEKKGAEEMKRILLIALFFIGIIFSLFANSCTAQIKEEYELQERCGKRAEEVFRKEYGHETISNYYTNHYNRKLNKCFILVTETVKQWDKELIEKLGVSSTYKTLLDINEKKPYGIFRKLSKGTLMNCEVLEKHCNSESEWDALVKPYMEE